MLSEFAPDGELLFGASYPREGESYRAFRFPWTGKPEGEPAIAAESREDDRVTVYASWNGATEVESWQVLAGPAADRLEPIGSAPRKGFETEIEVQTKQPWVGVRARDGAGEPLGTIRAMEVNPR